jgi:hypothetical protein
VSRARITRNWTQFFNASTPTSKRIAVLQHGQKFRPLLIAQSKSPLAQQSSAGVNGVTVNGPTNATVEYTVLVAGRPALKNQQGTAIKSDGTWKVFDQSFCHLLGLQGKTPASCPAA